MSRLTIDITDQQHQDLKAMAEFRQLLAERLAEASRGEASTKSISEIAANVMQIGDMA